MTERWILTQVAVADTGVPGFNMAGLPHVLHCLGILTMLLVSVAVIL